MKIKKVDDKPMVIHTKQKAKGNCVLCGHNGSRYGEFFTNLYKVEIVEVDDDMQLLISGWYVWMPSLSLYLRAGVACVFDEEAGMYMPDFDVTVLYEELASDKWIYYEQDGFVVTLGNWLNGRLPIGNIETLECHLVITDEDEQGWWEKENINTMDTKGELLLTIMDSLAQQESQSLSQNVRQL